VWYDTTVNPGVKRLAYALVIGLALAGCSHDWDPWRLLPGAGPSASIGSGAVGTCPSDMLLSPPAAGGVCVDAIEVTLDAFAKERARVATSCEVGQVDEGMDGSLPVGFVSACEAAAYCDLGGKRTCTKAEWQQACFRTKVDPVAACHVGQDTFVPAKSSLTCINDEGIADLIGNLWEWVCDGEFCVIVGGDASHKASGVSALCGLIDANFGAATGEASYVGFRCCGEPTPGAE